MTEVVAASNVVCSICSTTLLDAAVMRRVAISVMPPGPLKDDFRKDMGGVTDQFPLVPMGCALEAADAPGLKVQIERCLDGSAVRNPLRAAQEKYIRLDGQSAARVANLIESAER